MTDTFTIPPAAPKAVWRLGGITALHAALAVFILSEVFVWEGDFLDAGASPVLGWLMFSVGVLMAGLALKFAWDAFCTRSGRIEVSADGLRIRRGALYGRRIPLVVLRLDEARVVDLDEEPALQPILRTNGLDVSGYSVGWFGLRRLQRVLVFLTDRSRVLYLPTTEGYALMLSAERPAMLLAVLRQRQAERAAPA